MLVSVITVTFRNLEGLQATQASIPFENTPDIEWIVVDGGSDDGTPEYLAGLDIPQLKYCSEKDNGIFDAMNKGITMASGDFVIFMNAGDCFAEEDVLPKVIAQLEANPCDLLYGDSYEMDGNNALSKSARSPKWNIYSMFTHHQSIFYKRELIGDGYDLSYKLSGDWALTSRLLAQKNAVAKRFPGYVCRFEQGGVSQSGAHRDVFNSEHWRILREEACLPWPLAALSYSLKRSANGLRNVAPKLYEKMRFQKVSD
ncbi:glycosyltransferase family 2 protein [Celeribacter baekdonensis]|uniref:glycosyltransferase family 2 protein n=1 Tax=Celeribacter baekdonensis TaxID=875171 RepID=UPI0026F090F5|nr:glycosyltransferase family 2 protein [Celeribacter baekdonensis]|tara:strand:+ start:10975 stop:11745 length:771 start_codon:yes stop_codon:yes gene_type:complete